MPARRYHWSTKPEYDASCDDCSWRSNATNALGAAALHHDRTQHTVRTKRSSTTVYETPQRFEKRTGRKPPRPDQGRLL